MLVTLEGLDGSGKTTAWEALSDEYPEATFTREPTDSWYGDAVRRSLDSPAADPIAELFLYCADHADHLTSTIRPAVSKGALVISDRYVDSRVAYQGATLGEHIDDPHEFVRSLHEPFTLSPDLTCYLEVSVDTALERCGAETKFERRDMLTAVKTGYEGIAARSPERVITIDAERDPDSVVADIVEAIERRRQ